MKCFFIICTLPYVFNNCFCKQYRMSLISLEDCKDPVPPYINPLPFKLNLEVFNSTKGHYLVRGNLSVPEDIPAGDKRGTFSYGKVTPNNQIKWIATMKDLDCHSFVAKAIIGSYGIPLKGCVLKKGEYVFKDIDIDSMDTAFLAAPARMYGTYVSRGSIMSKTHTLACWVTHIKISPSKKQ